MEEEEEENSNVASIYRRLVTSGWKSFIAITSARKTIDWHYPTNPLIPKICSRRWLVNFKISALQTLRLSGYPPLFFPRIKFTNHCLATLLLLPSASSIALRNILPDGLSDETSSIKRFIFFKDTYSKTHCSIICLIETNVFTDAWIYVWLDTFSRWLRTSWQFQRYIYFSFFQIVEMGEEYTGNFACVILSKYNERILPICLKINNRCWFFNWFL